MHSGVSTASASSRSETSTSGSSLIAPNGQAAWTHWSVISNALPPISKPHKKETLMTGEFATLERTEDGGLIRYERRLPNSIQESGPHSRNLTVWRTGGLRLQPTSPSTFAREGSMSFRLARRPGTGVPVPAHRATDAPRAHPHQPRLVDAIRTRPDGRSGHSYARHTSCLNPITLSSAATSSAGTTASTGSRQRSQAILSPWTSVFASLQASTPNRVSRLRPRDSKCTHRCLQTRAGRDQK